MLNDLAVVSNTGMTIEFTMGAVLGLNIMATRLMPGASSLSNSNDLLATDGSSTLIPVMLPPGWDRLATKREPTGSATSENTIGIVCVSRASAAVTGVESCQQHVGLQTDKLFCECVQQIDVAAAPAHVDPHIAAFGPAELGKMPREFREQRLTFWIGRGITHEHADPPNLIGPLRVRRERPSSRGTGETGDEVTSPHRR